jgi:hypothetical protein
MSNVALLCRFVTGAKHDHDYPTPTNKVQAVAWPEMNPHLRNFALYRLPVPQVARFGLRNTLETRDAIAGTRELLRADIFADWRQGPTDAETGRSDLHCAISLTPAPWVTLSSGLRLPNGGGAPLESIQSIAFHSGDFWRTSFSWVELREITQARQLIWEGRVTLNSIYTLVATLNYDALAGQTTYQSIGIIQRIANSWELEYGVMQRLDPINNGKSSLGFQLRARLFKF